MKKLLVIFAVAAVMAGCLNRRGGATEPAQDYVIPEDVTDVAIEDLLRDTPGIHTAENSLDYAGTYKGTIPCADCSGIETVLTLNEDGTYKMTSKYLDKSDDVFTSEGTYTWDSDGIRITLDGGDAHGGRFLVGENIVYMLDRDGNRIDGQLADYYILRKE